MKKWREVVGLRVTTKVSDMKNVPEILSKKQQRNELETRIRLLFLLKKFLKNVEERIKQCGSLCEKDIPLLV